MSNEAKRTHDLMCPCYMSCPKDCPSCICEPSLSEDGIATDKEIGLPLSILCYFCGSKPFHSCINEETNKPMPFFHRARLKDSLRVKTSPPVVADGPAEGIATIEPGLEPTVVESQAHPGWWLVCNNLSGTRPYFESREDAEAYIAKLPPVPVEPAAPIVHPCRCAIENGVTVYCDTCIRKMESQPAAPVVGEIHTYPPYHPSPEEREAKAKPSQPAPVVVPDEEDDEPEDHIEIAKACMRYPIFHTEMMTDVCYVPIETLQFLLTAQPAPLPSDQKETK